MNTLPMQKVVDFQWSRNPDRPWTMMSVSDDAADEQAGGGSMQVWRINHLIYKDEEEVVAELEKHRYVCGSVPIERGGEPIAGSCSVCGTSAVNIIMSARIREAIWPSTLGSWL